MSATEQLNEFLEQHPAAEYLLRKTLYVVAQSGLSTLIHTALSNSSPQAKTFDKATYGLPLSTLSNGLSSFVISYAFPLEPKAPTGTELVTDALMETAIAKLLAVFIEKSAQYLPNNVTIDENAKEFILDVIAGALITAYKGVATAERTEEEQVEHQIDDDGIDDDGADVTHDGLGELTAPRGIEKGSSTRSI